jgi:hypothetical protein
LNGVVDRSITPTGRFHEGERDLQADVSAFTESNPEGAKHVAEYVVEVDEVAEVYRSWLVGETTGAKSRFAESVVSGALLGITEDLVGRIQIGKALMGRCVVRITIRMAFGSHSPEGGLDLGFVGMAGHAQRFIGAWHDVSGLA